MKATKLYQQLAKKLLWLLLTVLSLLAYVAEIRPFYILNAGIYFAGFFDGTLVILLILVVVFYYKSK